MLLILFALVITIGFYFLTLNYQYWNKRGVPGPKPKFFVGNMGENFLLKKSPAEVFADIYKQFEDAPMVGVFRTVTPTLVIRDLDLIKDIMVKSFKNFHDNDLIINQKVDSVLGKNPFFLRGEEWKLTRTQLTPGFTSGKMKWIYPMLENVSRQFVEFIAKHPTATNGEGCHVKNLCMKFGVNSVAIGAFGLEGKCFEEENSELKQIADRFFTPDGWLAVKIFISDIIPSLNQISINFTPKYVEEKMTKVVTETLKYREENNIFRNDFLQILQQLKSGKNSQFTNIDAIAHAAGYLADASETSSIVMHFLFFELASNPETQTKLRQEIKKAFEENNNSLPYEVIQNLPYLNGVLNETLRFYPPLGSLNKTCTKSFIYKPKANDVIKKPVVIEANTAVIIPLYALQRDPKHFDDPERFKPERFIGPNKNNIKKYSLMPFGQGPRMCLGQRFASLQIKIGVAYVVKNYELFVNKKTKLPIKYHPLYFLTLPKDALYLDFKRIN